MREDAGDGRLGGRRPHGAVAIEWRCRRISEDPGSPGPSPYWSGDEGLCQGRLAGSGKPLTDIREVGAARNDKRLYGRWVCTVLLNLCTVGDGGEEEADLTRQDVPLAIRCWFGAGGGDVST